MMLDATDQGTAPSSADKEPYLPGTQAIEWIFQHLIEIPVCLLLVSEIVVLLIGVVARYVFRHSLVWSDELAGLIFLWLAMLGAVSASRRFDHMRMTAFFLMAGPRTKRFLDVFATLGALLFLGSIVSPAWRYAVNQAVVTMPALSISDAWRASALPAGVILMAVVTILHLLRLRIRDILPPLAAMAIIVGALFAFGDGFDSLGNFNLVLFFVILFAAAVFSSIPIAFAFGLVTVGYLVLTTNVPTIVILGRMNEGMAAPLLPAIPLFIFLGLLIQTTGMAKAMVDFLASLLGHVRGGLSYALVAALYLVSGISGSKAADMAAIAPALLPEMHARGAKSGRLVALLAATGAQTETVPPSIVLITIGSVANVSIAALFTGGLLPGLVLALILCALIAWQANRNSAEKTGKLALNAIGSTFVKAIPALLLPLLIRAAVVEGVTTATEVATIGIVYVLICGPLMFQRFGWPRLWSMLVETASLAGAILFVMGAASAMAWALTQSGFASLLAQLMQEVPGGRIGFLLASAAIFVVIGSVLEGIPAIVLFGPLLFPVARAAGIHEVHYAVVVVISMGIGLFAPPFGVGYYIACTIAKISPEVGMRPMIPYLIALLLGLLILIFVPWLSIGFL